MKNKIIYLMGAGRSGTTALAAFLNASEDIISLGELHQLPEYVLDNRSCSCGPPLSTCDFWSKYPIQLGKFSTKQYILQQKKLESHRSVVKYFDSGFSQLDFIYHQVNSELISSIYDSTGKTVLDSAKFVGRALALASNKDLDVKIIYMTRDPRGVVESFSKKVQTSKNMLSACIYYCSINLLAELSCFFLLRGRILKIRYEDLLTNPIETFTSIGRFSNIDVSCILYKINRNDSFEIGHIVGGNRLKNNQLIKFYNLDNWQHKVSLVKRLSVYLLTFPFNLLNGYKP